MASMKPMVGFLLGVAAIAPPLASAQSISSKEFDSFVAQLVNALDNGRPHGDVVIINADYPGEDASDILVKIGKPAVPHLIAALKSRSEWTRTHAAECLGKVKARGAERPLLDAIANKHERNGVKCSMIEALGQVGGQESLSTLITLSDHPELGVNLDQVSSDDDEKLIAESAVKALGELGNTSSISCILSHTGLKVPHQVGVDMISYEPAYALARLGGPGIRALEGFVKGDGSDIEGACVSALADLKRADIDGFLIASLGERKARKFVSRVPDATAAEFKPWLNRMLFSNDFNDRDQAARSVWFTKDRSLTPLLCRALVDAAKAHVNEVNQGAQCDVLVYLADSLGPAKNRASGDALISSLDELYARSDFNQYSLTELLKAVPLLRPEQASRLSRFVLQPRSDWEANTREYASSACGAAGLGAMAPLSKAYSGGKLGIDLYTSAIESIADPHCLPLVLEAMKSENPHLRDAGFSALCRIPGEAADQIFCQMLMDRKQELSAATELLLRSNKVGLEYAEKRGIPEFPHLDGFVEAFEKFATPDLEKALACQWEPVRLFAAMALVKRGENGQVPVLQRIAESGQGAAAIEAVRLLAKHKSSGVEASLLKAFRRHELNVRTAAYLAIFDSPQAGH